MPPTGIPVAMDDVRVLLGRTPAVLDAWLRGLPDRWVRATEGPDTWSPVDIVGHLIHGERTDWIPRIEHMLAHGDAIPFSRFDRFAQFDASQVQTLEQRLDTFRELRGQNLQRLADLRLTDRDFDRPGLHPDLGAVTIGQLLATMVAHDFDHLMQIARVLGRQYAEAVGPWQQYLRVVRPL